MSEIFRLLKNFFSNIPALIRSLFWKRDESIVLMDSWFGEKFADNPRFLYQFLSDNKEKLCLSHVVWVTRNSLINDELNRMGYESYMIDSKESIFYHKHAKYHIVNNSPNNNDGFTGELLEGYSFGAKRINLWHGVAGKGVKFANKAKVAEYSKNKLYNVYLKLHNIRLWRLLFEQKCGWEDAFYLTQSTENLRILKECFRLPDKNYIQSGYPRVCSNMILTENEKRLLDKINGYDYTFLYLPTFRDAPSGNDSELINRIKSSIDSENILWIQKGHSVSKQEKKCNADSDKFIELNVDFDINVLIPHISCLITDYSSCFIEAMYYRKDLIFYVPDFEEYISKSRGLMYDPESTLAGPVCKSVDELVSQINSYSQNVGKIKKENYEQVRSIFWAESENKSLEDIWKDILSYTE